MAFGNNKNSTLRLPFYFYYYLFLRFFVLSETSDFFLWFIEGAQLQHIFCCMDLSNSDFFYIIILDNYLIVWDLHILNGVVNNLCVGWDCGDEGQYCCCDGLDLKSG